MFSSFNSFGLLFISSKCVGLWIVMDYFWYFFVVEIVVWFVVGELVFDIC